MPGRTSVKSDDDGLREGDDKVQVQSIQQEDSFIYMDVKELSGYIHVKVSTLYAWVSQKRIPYIKIHGLIRFRKEEIDPWVESFRDKDKREEVIGVLHTKDNRDIDSLIEKAKREVYNSDRGETTSPKSALRKEKSNGAV